MVLRPDEQANLSEIDRYKKENENIKSGLKTAANVGLSATALGLSSKLLPFLNDFIPVDLAIKGISKVSPQIGSFLKKGQSAGLDIKEGLDFIKSKMEDKSQPNNTSQDNRNIIEQYSPELNQFINEQMGRGMTAEQAGAIAFNDNKFRQTIEKMTRDHKAPFSKLIQMVYGQTNQSVETPVEPQQAKSGGDWSQITETLKNILAS